MAVTTAMIKSINLMGIVCTFKETEFFLRNICGKELQRSVQHSPLDRPARISNSWFSCDDKVAWYLQNYGFYPNSTADYRFFYRLWFQIPDYSFPLNAVLSISISGGNLNPPHTRIWWGKFFSNCHLEFCYLYIQTLYENSFRNIKK